MAFFFEDNYSSKKYNSWLFEQAEYDYMHNGIKEVAEERCKTSYRNLHENELIAYDDISQVPKEVLAKASLGPRKISASLIERIISRNLLIDGNENCGISHSCIDTLIYLCSIQDNSGYIPNFRIKSLVGMTCASLRGVYFVLAKLEEKRFISVSCHSKNGYRDITVLNNDFTKYNKDTRYLNLNRLCFTPCDPELYNQKRTPISFNMFRELSLFAKKMYLYLLFQYDAAGGKRGYRGSINKLADKLNISDKSLILEYVNEIKPLCVDTKAILEGWDSNIHTYKSKKTGSSDIIVNLRPGRCGAESTLIQNAPTCLKYRIENIFVSNHINVYDRKYKTPITRAERYRIVEELSGLITWHSVHYKDSPITINDMIKLCEDFVTECEFFFAEHVSAFGIYLREFINLSRQGGYVVNEAFL